MRKRTKHIFIAFAVVFGIIIFMVMGGYLYLNSPPGQKYIQTTINKNIPGSISWEYGRVSVLKGEIEIKNGLIKEPGNGDIAGFDRFFIKLSMSPLLRGNLTVKALLLDRPWTHLRVDTTGEMNLVRTFVPAIPEDRPHEEQRATQTTPLAPVEIIIKQFDLSQGSLHFETDEGNTVIMLQEIDLAAQADLSKQSGKLALHIGRGNITSGEIRAGVDECTLDATFGNGRIDQLVARIQSPLAGMKLSGAVTDIFDRPSLRATIDYTASLHEIQKSFNLKQTLTGRATGQLKLTGILDNPDLNLRLDYEGGTILENIIDRINLDLRLNDRLATIDVLKIDVADGIITGQGSMDLRQAFQKGFLSPERDLEAVSYDLSVVGKDVHLEKLRHDVSGWRGAVHSSLLLRGKGFSLQGINTDASLTINGENISTQQFVAPVDLRISSDLEMSRGIATIKKLGIRAGRSELNADGFLDIPSRNMSGKLSLNAPDLAESLSPLGFNDLHGTIELKATVTGSTEQPLFALDLQGTQLHFQDITLGNIRLKAGLDKSGILKLSHCTVDNGASNLRITGTSHVYDRTTMERNANPAFKLNIRGDALHLDDFIQTIKGTVSLAGHFEGTIMEPRGTMTLRGNDFDLYGQKLAEINLTAGVDDRKIRFDPFQIFVTPAESVRCSGWISFQKEYDLKLLSRGISLRNIAKVREQDIADGLVLIDITGHGTFENPMVTGGLSVNNVRIRGKDLEDFHVTMDLHDHMARFKGKLNFDLDGSYDLKKHDFFLAALFDETDLSPFFKIAGKDDFSGKLTGNVEAHGNAESIKTIAADVKIGELDIVYKETAILQSRDLTVSLKNEIITLPESTLILPPEGMITIGGKGDLAGSGMFRADGSIPLTLVGNMMEDLSDIQGTLSIASSVEGTLRRPHVNADLSLENVGCTVPVLMQKLHGLNGKIRIEGETVTLDGIGGYIDTGSFNLEGGIKLRENFQPERVSVTVNAAALPIHVPDTLDVLINSALRIEGTEEKSVVRGDIIILEGMYYKDVNLSLFQGIGQRRRETPPPREEITTPFLKNMNLDISIIQRNPFLVDNNLATLDIIPDLHVVGSISNPIIRGRATIASGTVRYQGKSFIVTRGIIDFTNPYKTDPFFDVGSEVTVRNWMIFLEVTGTLDEINFKLSSNPPEEHGDILSLLLLGRTTGELIAGEGGTTQSTEQMLAGLIASTFGEDIKEATGLDIFEVETAPENDQSASDRIRVTLGKELSKRTTIKYSVESKDGEVIQRAVAEYKLLEHIFARGFQDTRGIYGGELQFRLEFR